MSLVRSVDSSTPPYGDSVLYTLKSNDECHNLYGQYSSSSLQRFSTRQTSFFHSSSSGIPGTVMLPQGSGSYQLMGASGPLVTAQNPYEEYFRPARASHSSLTASIIHPTPSISEYFDRGSPEGGMDYDEEEIRLKIEELERELLCDNDDYMLDLDQSSSIDSELAGPLRDLLLPSSPKDSFSSDSNLTTNSSSKEMPLVPISSPQSCTSPTPKKLLFECAGAILEGNMEEASAIIAELRQMVSIQGDPSERIAAYMVEGLAARMGASGHVLYKALKCKEPPTSDRLSAMQILFEICPCFKYGFTAANSAIAEAFKDEKKVHIIDFDINQGSQYITLIQTLAKRPGKPPHVRITGVDDPESVQRLVGGLKIVGQRLEKFAEAVGVPFEFQAIAAKTVDVTPSTLGCRPSEALVVNFAFQLHHMPDESVSTVNQRDQLLRMVKSLGPKLVTVVEQDVNTNTAPFFPRFVEAYNYYSAVFESLDVTLPRESADRMNVERQCLAREIVNIVACEGEERIERYEVAGKWRARMMMAGFVACPLTDYVNGEIQSLQKSYCNRFKVKEESGALCFGWEDKTLIVASAWR
eukprot:TRINITY_DN4097_c0_g1_i1.p1 TRINITY_DN4097_c0_g1~~TRINITY_DN4097_c0_g1_i1.p1  ORF type:complete len:583 (+),score=121.65 TRINITY_DN4097_c0_g1_i1:568-2316(+)